MLHNVGQSLAVRAWVHAVRHNAWTPLADNRLRDFKCDDSPGGHSLFVASVTFVSFVVGVCSAILILATAGLLLPEPKNIAFTATRLTARTTTAIPPATIRLDLELVLAVIATVGELPRPTCRGVRGLARWVGAILLARSFRHASRKPPCQDRHTHGWRSISRLGYGRYPWRPWQLPSPFLQTSSPGGSLQSLDLGEEAVDLFVDIAKVGTKRTFAVDVDAQCPICTRERDVADLGTFSLLAIIGAAALLLLARDAMKCLAFVVMFVTLPSFAPPTRSCGGRQSPFSSFLTCATPKSNKPRCWNTLKPSGFNSSSSLVCAGLRRLP